MQLINEIVKYCQKIDRKGFAANHDGNISARFDTVLLATPTAVSKGNIDAASIITLDMNGNKIAGVGKPFSEIQLHLACYRSRTDVQAVVHAHPPFATARGLVLRPLRPVLPEAIVSLGDLVPVLDFVMPGAKANETMMVEALQKYDVVMLPGNGVLAVGDNVEQAYLRLELVEHLCRIDFYAAQMGNQLALSPDDVSVLLEKRAKAGLGPKGRIAKPSGTNSAPVTTVKTNLIDAKLADQIVNLVTEELLNSQQR